VRSNFSEDVDDPHLYDLVFNTGLFASATIAGLMVAALRGHLRDSHSPDGIPDFVGEPSVS